MLVHFQCKNCNNHFEAEESLIKHISAKWVCLKCGGDFSITNLEEIVKFDLEEQVKNYVDKYLKEYGIEGAIELVERNSNSAVYRLYKSEFEKRGIKLKE